MTDDELTFEIMVHHDCNAQERCDMCDNYRERDSVLVFLVDVDSDDEFASFSFFSFFFFFIYDG